MADPAGTRSARGSEKVRSAQRKLVPGLRIALAGAGTIRSCTSEKSALPFPIVADKERRLPDVVSARTPTEATLALAGERVGRVLRGVLHFLSATALECVVPPCRHWRRAIVDGF